MLLFFSLGCGGGNGTSPRDGREDEPRPEGAPIAFSSSSACTTFNFSAR